jgi:hypothetical protein
MKWLRLRSHLGSGEGTIDLDKWINTTTTFFYGMQKKIAGAYRMEVLKFSKYGIEGFYLNDFSF